MEKKYIVLDGFYPDPNSVRQQALALDYPYISNYPGKRSNGPSDDIYDLARIRLESALGTTITTWNKFRDETVNGDITSMNGTFQSCFLGNRTWVHHDYMDWAAVVYLDPTPDPDSGTGIFRHKSTGIDQYIKSDPKTELNKSWETKFPEYWELIFEVKNRYNRAIIYPGSMYHRSMVPGYGDTIDNGRLTQVFFFNIN